MRASLAILALAIAAPLCAGAAPSPKPSASTRHVVVHLPLSKVPLHTEFNVEVNKMGQVVRVESGKSSKDLMYNAQTYGNVLQMWIRKGDGTAEVGLFRVTYDYSPKTHKVSRNIALVREGGNWGDKQGAVNQMLAADKKSAQKNAPNPQGTGDLPSLESITGTPKPHPTSH